MLKVNRLAVARDACRRAFELDPQKRIAVGLSGGKDSLATLKLVSEVWPEVFCYHLYFVPGLRVLEDHVNACAARFTKTPVLYLPHPDVSRYLKGGIFQPSGIGSAQMGKRRVLKMGDIEHTVRETFGLTWIASGLKVLDSIHRRGQLHGKNGVDERWHRLWPVYDWSDADVVSFNSHQRFPNPPKFGGGRLSGIGLDGPTMVDLKARAPDDYERIRAVFPYVDALVVREEMRQKRAQASAIEPSERGGSSA